MEYWEIDIRQLAEEKRPYQIAYMIAVLVNLPMHIKPLVHRNIKLIENDESLSAKEKLEKVNYVQEKYEGVLARRKKIIEDLELQQLDIVLSERCKGGLVQ